MKLQFSAELADDLEDTDWSKAQDVDTTRWADTGDEERICAVIEDKAEEWADQYHSDTAWEWPDKPSEYTKIYALVDGKTLYELAILLEYEPTFIVGSVKRKPKTEQL